MPTSEQHIESQANSGRRSIELVFAKLDRRLRIENLGKS